MTIIERNSIDSPWLFRTQPLQTGQTQSTREVALELTQPTVGPSPVSPPVSIPIKNQPTNSYVQLAKPIPPIQRTVPQPVNPLRVRSANAVITVDPKKVLKSSTDPNLRQNHSTNNIFRVI